jgi:hypothetical protein
VFYTYGFSQPPKVVAVQTNNVFAELPKKEVSAAMLPKEVEVSIKTKTVTVLGGK